MSKIKAFQVRLPTELWKELKFHSINKEISMNLLIEIALRKFLKNNKKTLEDE